MQIIGTGPGSARRDPARQASFRSVRGVVTQSTGLEVRDRCPHSLWPQDPSVSHKCHQSHLEQNGFNQLHHPHSPGSGATKRLGSCPQRTVRLKCPSTLQGPGWAGRGLAAGGRGRGRKWRRWWNTGKLRALAVPGPQPGYSCFPRPLERERSWRRDGEQVPAAGEAAAAVSFTNKYTSLPS